MDLTCPKCHGSMRSYERNGVTVDQCTECRGIFLDRGELERLVDAENRWHEHEPSSAQGAAGYAQGSSGHGASGHGGAAAGGLGAVVGEVLRQAGTRSSGSGHGSSSGYGQSGYGQSRRKKSFLDELFG
ncbi:zf-TFIIB domain-containing protein [Quadrisphaera sp. DSM 44207]|uniref:TFIIB-type zinc ribbon-containing protein n=1 Tax=Quadrisphaera sp. DSM 44207 TaxID=1881057 RepID=UPI000887373C|nr:zf-TFIIB domain-containing protein [Quadrisphaera sp. DSM 44207]SDQ65105.1 hypothetical protein SAMN05428996_2241 [Quadrisphaera sp. DSM 44207]